MRTARTMRDAQTADSTAMTKTSTPCNDNVTEPIDISAPTMAPMDAMTQSSMPNARVVAHAHRNMASRTSGLRNARLRR